jgi:hypothetical protein
MNNFSICFRVVGPLSGERRLCEGAVAFIACCRCDPAARTDTESYLSAFQFDEEFQRFVNEHGTVAGFSGPTWALYIWFDIDREDDLESARMDASKLITFLNNRFGCRNGLLIFFSGKKGFHIGLSTQYFADCEPSIDFHRITRNLAEHLAGLAGVQIDTGIYDRVRCFRAPNSRHPKTGLHKRRLTLAELTDLGVTKILELAQQPRPFTPPKLLSNVAQHTDWRDTADRVAAASVVRAQIDQQGREQLNRLTLDYIRNGAAVGERHNHLFSAAANLAEFDCPLKLAEALLMESALNCGIAPDDARRHITRGLDHGTGRKS